MVLLSLGLSSFMPFGWCRDLEARYVPKSMHSDLATFSAGCGFQGLSTWGNGSWSTPSWWEVLWHRCLFCLSVELQVYCWKESKNPRQGLSCYTLGNCYRFDRYSLAREIQAVVWGPSSLMPGWEPLPSLASLAKPGRGTWFIMTVDFRLFFPPGIGVSVCGLFRT